MRISSGVYSPAAAIRRPKTQPNPQFSGQQPPEKPNRKKYLVPPLLALALLGGQAQPLRSNINEASAASITTVQVENEATRQFYNLLNQYIDELRNGSVTPDTLSRYGADLRKITATDLSNEDRAYRIIWQHDIEWRKFEASDTRLGSHRPDLFLGTPGESAECLLNEAAMRGQQFRRNAFASQGGIGPAAHTAMIQHRGYVNLTSVQVIQLMRRDYATLEAQMNNLARRIDPAKSSWQEVYVDISKKHPARNQVLDAYRREAERAQRFLEAHDVITIPPDSELNIRETPEYMRRSLPYAAYSPGMRTMWVTVTMDDNPDTEEQQLRDHNHGAIGPVTVHEGFPGHHLDFLHKAQSDERLDPNDPKTPARRFLLRYAEWDSSFYREGWGLYSEQFMLDNGYYEEGSATAKEADEKRLVAMRMILWRVTRAMLDAEIHGGKTDFNQAVDFLVNNLVMDRERSEAEVSRYFYAPTGVASYYLGMRQLVQLWEEVKKKNPDANWREFHDQIQKTTLPIPVLAMKLYGIELPDLQPRR